MNRNANLKATFLFLDHFLMSLHGNISELTCGIKAI